ncbi:MAG TPA: MoaD/ThiS family protein [Thermoplasmata archaeon]|nr:MoaD/ThiS family protein [Thermoplasmata archaeon]
MQLRVRLFATYREIVGAKDLAWTTDPGTTLGQFLDAFLRRHPKLAPHRDTMMLAVNRSFAEPSTVLKEGDEVALLPPVSGGAA